MLIIRKYKRTDWFDFLDRMELELSKSPERQVYFEFMDELKMRKLESISEGGIYKLKIPASVLLSKFKERITKDNSFASAQDFEDFEQIAESIL